LQDLSRQPSGSKHFRPACRFAIVPLVSLRRDEKKSADGTAWQSISSETDAKFFYFVTGETVDSKAKLHARMPFYGGRRSGNRIGGRMLRPRGWQLHGVIDRGGAGNHRTGTRSAPSPVASMVRAEKSGDKVANVHVGGYCVEARAGRILDLSLQQRSFCDFCRFFLSFFPSHFRAKKKFQLT